MTTLHSQEKNMRVPHHPARLNEADEVAWRAQRRAARFYRWLLVLCWISFVGLLAIVYIRGES